MKLPLAITNVFYDRGQSTLIANVILTTSACIDIANMSIMLIYCSVSEQVDRKTRLFPPCAV